MFSRLKKWNTLRNQILVVFLFVMAIVLLIVGTLTFNQVSTMLKNNADKQIKQTAVEANGRLGSLYEQIDTASKLIMMNNNVQTTLLDEYEGIQTSFAQRQQLMGIVNMIQANSEGIFSFELYTSNRKHLLPLDDRNLTTRVSEKWIQQVDAAKGRLVWIGKDPDNPDNLLALRRVNLLDHGFNKGGYLLIRIYRNYFQFTNQESDNNLDQYSILLDKNYKPILSNYEGALEPIIKNNIQTIFLDKQEYMVTKQISNETGWTIIILTPVNDLTKGINVLRMGIIFSGIIGYFIYFICSLFLSNIITRPILKLTKTMERVSNGTLTMAPKVLSANEIVELNSTYNHLVKEINHLIEMVYQKEIIRSQNELKALQAQINPHFLFNTLDALRWSLEEKDEEELAEFVVAMSNLFRYTITKKTDGDWVTIKEEIQHIVDYIEIMKMRFGEHVNWNLNLSPEWEYVKIPKLLIQPLVENAVLHGAGNTVENCTITISIYQDADKDYLQILVQDDGPGVDEEKLAFIKKSIETGERTSERGSGMALSNVYKRLQLYYQDRLKQGLTITSEVNVGTTVSFIIPVNGGETC
ncbi:sensor histidine kinase [Neobacillus cucumis]|uniref:sensor histidine kinase n=1 Tax=Neobacillus cucumis TaxID=1740721 RepID=UPI002E1ADE70|nr:histidine kinase [Neobacillus cucumis]MED4226275.1 histidine kinase [Neobacillus cucumis]